jgi:hypothetical protein
LVNTKQCTSKQLEIVIGGSAWPVGARKEERLAPLEQVVYLMAVLRDRKPVHHASMPHAIQAAFHLDASYNNTSLCVPC